MTPAQIWDAAELRAIVVGIPGDEIEACDPRTEEPKMPRRTVLGRYTPRQRAALLALADAHDALLVEDECRQSTT